MQVTLLVLGPVNNNNNNNNNDDDDDESPGRQFMLPLLFIHPASCS